MSICTGRDDFMFLVVCRDDALRGSAFFSLLRNTFRWVSVINIISDNRGHNFGFFQEVVEYRMKLYTFVNGLQRRGR